jgi:HEAT repeat protein
MWSAILSAEDSRPTSVQALGPLAGGLRYPDPEMRRLAVRGLGRLESDTVHSPNGPLSLIEVISYALHDSSAAVRLEAANAMAQAAQHGSSESTRDSLLVQLKVEHDFRVRGMIARSLGRLPFHASPSIEAALLEVSADTVLPAVLGAAHGMQSFYQLGGPTPSPRAITRLRELAILSSHGRGGPARADSVARVRRLVVSALIASGTLNAAAAQNVSVDPDAQVRRLAVLATGIDSFPDRTPLVTKGMHDGSPMVRYEALQAYGRKLQPSAGCEPILQALNDQSPHVVLLAVDLLGNGCKGAEGPQAADRLFALARQLTPAFVDRGNSTPPAWQQPAHAIVALARVAPDRADSLLPTFVGHTTSWVRTYAARAAATLRKNRVLEQLAYDANDNVREAAIRGLSQVEGHAADSIYLAALSRPDYQLLITASQALDSTPNPAPAVAALTNALLRVTGENRETSRDTRMALLERIGTLGTAAQKSQIQVYLYDWDRVVAARTAAILSRWSGAGGTELASLLPTAVLVGNLPTGTFAREVSSARGGLI